MHASPFPPRSVICLLVAQVFNLCVFAVRNGLGAAPRCLLVAQVFNLCVFTIRNGPAYDFGRTRHRARVARGPYQAAFRGR